MIAFPAIVRLTCRSAVRSKVFRFLLLLLLFCAVAVPLTIKGDGTITGEVQILLEYSTGIVGFILSASVIWMTCAEFCTDMENGQIHMIFVKPVSRLVVWAGKFTGVFLIHIVLLFIAGTVIYLFAELKHKEIFSREKNRMDVALEKLNKLQKGEIAQQDIKETAESVKKNLEEAQANLVKIENEVFTARRVYLPVVGNMNEKVRAELQRRIQESKAVGRDLPAVYGNERRKFIDSVRMELLAKMGEVKPGSQQTWKYEGLPDDFNGVAYIRYKFYSGEIYGKDQKLSFGAWQMLYAQEIPDENAQGKVREVRMIPMAKAPEQLLSGVYHEFALPGRTDSGQKFFHNGKTELTYFNLTEPGKGPSVHFQVLESPKILIKVSSFTSNFFRMLLVTAMGLFALCLVAAFASSFLTMPTALFISLAYIFLGLFAKYIVSNIDVMGGHDTVSLLDRIGGFTGESVASLLIPIQDFFASSLLSVGELIEYSFMLDLFIFNILLKGLPLCVVGMYLYYRRETALAMRK